MARQVTVEILGDAKNFTKATQEATAVSGHMSAGLGKASGAAQLLKKDLHGLAAENASAIPGLNTFGSTLQGIPLPALAVAGAIGAIVIAGKSVMEISEKWE